MQTESYMQWLVRNTATRWWHDSGDPDELVRALDHGASGVTTNPVLTNGTLHARGDFWRERIQGAGPEACVQAVVNHAAQLFLPEHDRSRGEDGYVCAQVNPSLVGDRDAMLAMARRFHAFAPNIAVKLPVTAAGLDVLETCVAEGITVTGTVSFCVPQVLAVADRHRRGADRARQAGRTPGRGYAVIMIGRIDDYLREIAQDTAAQVSEDDIRAAGIAMTKRAYALFQEQGYEAELVIAALRGPHHMVEVAGADFIMSIHPAYQDIFLEQDLPREERIHEAVPAPVINRLMSMPEFVKGYEPDGLDPKEFIAYGVTQRTLSQFYETGWKGIEAFAAAL